MYPYDVNTKKSGVQDGMFGLRANFRGAKMECLGCEREIGGQLRLGPTSSLGGGTQRQQSMSTAMALVATRNSGQLEKWSLQVGAHDTVAALLCAAMTYRGRTINDSDLVKKLIYFTSKSWDV